MADSVFIRYWLVVIFSAYVCLCHAAAFQEAVAVWPAGQEKEKNLTVQFRAVLDYNNGAEHELFITASSAYKVHINGEFLGHGPCVAAHGFFRLDQYALDNLLEDGANIIAIEVAGYNMPSFYLLDQPSFLQAEIRIGGQTVIATGSGESGFEAQIAEDRVREVPRYSHARPYIEQYVMDASYNDWRIDPRYQFKRVDLVAVGSKQIIDRGVPYPDYSLIHSVESVGDTIFRFPYNATGFLGFEIHVTEPAELTVLFDELLKEDDVDPTRLVCNNYLNFTLAPGVYQFETFEPYTMQYVKPIFAKGAGNIRNWHIRQYVGADVWGAQFSASDTRLPRIFEAARETLRQNALDVLMDCPSRERGPWLGDGYFTARAAMAISGNAVVERNFFQNYQLPEKFHDVPEGMLPMCYPCDHPNRLFIPNWAMWFVIQLEEYASRSGDTAMVSALQDRVAGLIAYFDQFRNADGLLENLEQWVFLDWSAANDFTSGVNYPTNMMYAKVLNAAGNLYQNPEWINRAAKIKQVILDQSYDGRLFRDQATRQNGSLTQQPHTTEACQYYAFYFDVVSPASHPVLWQLIRDGLGPKRYADGHINAYPDIYLSNTFMGEYMRMELLCRYGAVAQFIAENTPNLMRQVALTGTLWEQQYRTLNTSCSHGFATHVAYLFQRAIAGVDKIDVMNKRIRVVFRNTGLTWSNYRVPLDKGTLSVSWKIDRNRLTYSVQVPEGYEFEVLNETTMPIYARSTIK